MRVTAPAAVSVTGAPTGTPPGPGGRDVTLTAAVAGIAGDPVATGTVEWFEGTTSLGTAPLGAGAATLTVPNVALGDHRYRAAFTPNPDTPFLGASSPETTVAVLPPSPTAPTTSTATLRAPHRVHRGARPTVTVTVLTGGAPATGTVTFAANGHLLGTVTLAGGHAAWRLPKLNRNTVVTITYPGGSSAGPVAATQFIHVKRSTGRAEGK